jgi:type IV pilus assembly protein PilM
LSSLTSASLSSSKTGVFGRFTNWLDAMPHPASVCEIAGDHVSAARWSGTGGLDSAAVEALEPGIVKPSPVDSNVLNAEELRAALRRVLDRAGVRGQMMALLVPDPAVRVFILPFENLPRRSEEYLPLLRWRLKKSVPFDVEETVISSTRQIGREGNLEVIAAVARKTIIREYEEALEAVDGVPGVVLSSTFACLPLLDESAGAMLVRVAGSNLTTAIVRGSNLCVYRSTEMAGADPAGFDARSILDEIFPAVAYYQDTWGGELERVLVAGFGEREEAIRTAITDELHATALPLSDGETSRSLPGEARDLIARGGEALVGWMANAK